MPYFYRVSGWFNRAKQPDARLSGHSSNDLLGTWYSVLAIAPHPHGRRRVSSAHRSSMRAPRRATFIDQHRHGHRADRARSFNTIFSADSKLNLAAYQFPLSKLGHTRMFETRIMLLNVMTWQSGPALLPCSNYLAVELPSAGTYVVQAHDHSSVLATLQLQGC